jgi:hypothetical protein
LIKLSAGGIKQGDELENIAEGADADHQSDSWLQLTGDKRAGIGRMGFFVIVVED